MSEKAGHIHPCWCPGTGHNSGYCSVLRGAHWAGVIRPTLPGAERESSAAAVAARR